MTRVRLARNLKDYPFRADPITAKEIVKKVNRALLKCDTFNLYFTANLDDLTLLKMNNNFTL
jgi:protein-arginine kinase